MSQVELDMDAIEGLLSHPPEKIAEPTWRTSQQLARGWLVEGVMWGEGRVQFATAWYSPMEPSNEAKLPHLRRLDQDQLPTGTLVAGMNPVFMWDGPYHTNVDVRRPDTPIGEHFSAYVARVCRSAQIRDAFVDPVSVLKESVGSDVSELPPYPSPTGPFIRRRWVSEVPGEDRLPHLLVADFDTADVVGWVLAMRLGSGETLVRRYEIRSPSSLTALRLPAKPSDLPDSYTFITNHQQISASDHTRLGRWQHGAVHYANPTLIDSLALAIKNRTWLLLSNLVIALAVAIVASAMSLQRRYEHAIALTVESVGVRAVPQRCVLRSARNRRRRGSHDGCVFLAHLRRQLSGNPEYRRRAGLLPRLRAA